MARILLVAGPQDAAALLPLLREAGHADVLHALSTLEAFSMLQNPEPSRPVELILLDLPPPGLDGVQAARRLTEDPRFRAVPLVVLAPPESREALETLLSLGAADEAVSKPVLAEELVLRIRSALRAKGGRTPAPEADAAGRAAARLRWEEARLKRREQELVEARLEIERLERELDHLSIRDPLTGVANRRLFTERLAHEWRRAIRTSSPLGLVILDLDFFKGFNDVRGHAAGNECLKRVAGALHASLPRPGDLLARFGGEEFAALLPATDGAGARRVGERLRHVVESLGIPHPRSAASSRITVSGGAACLLPSSAASPSNLTEAAEQALHMAKAGGRNCVLLANGSFQGRPSAPRQKKVLFVCVENSCRSQMAQAFARKLGAEAYSAGSSPSGQVHPKAVAFMKEVGCDLSAHVSKSLLEIPPGPYDAVAAMGCGDACPALNARVREDWEIPDPKDLPPQDFRRVRDQIELKVRELLGRL